jgi:hypothetical protein
MGEAGWNSHVNTSIGVSRECTRIFYSYKDYSDMVSENNQIRNTAF